MKMSMSGQMRMEQRMKLAPRMIQSMEVLQLPLLALQEKIEMELASNPVLEQADEQPDEMDFEGSEAAEVLSDEQVEQKELVVSEDGSNVDDFRRLDSLEDSGDGYDDYMARSGSFSLGGHRGGGDIDKKMQAMQNTAASAQSLNEYLTEQWRLVEAEESVKKAGQFIIDYIDEKGYLTVKLEHLYNKDRGDFNVEHLYAALELVQKLEPAGVGARDMKECLLIQMAQRGEDMSFEIELVSNHFQELLENKLPQIAKKMNCDIEDINFAISRMSKLDTSPGLTIGRNDNYPITADVIIHADPDGDGYVVSLKDTNVPNLRVNNFYTKMSRSRNVDIKTREFLQQNIRSARWLMDAIEQRRETLLKVASAVVRYQYEFFEKGKLYLRPLPMATIADEVGVHVATVSRAVAGKYVQCPQGVLPLRGFFSGGMEDEQGQSHSWDAVRAKLQQIVDGEDKSNPLNDDEIRMKLSEAGIGDIARRTVAKYRKLMNIPAARFRRKY